MQPNLNSMSIRRENRKKVFQFLCKGGVYSKRDIASAINMSLPTVSQNLQDLMNRKLVLQVGSLESTGGRKAQGVQINVGAHYAVGLDITRNHAAIVILDLSGNIVSLQRVKLPFVNTETYFQTVGQMVDNALLAQTISPEKVLGVGISVPAIVSKDQLMLSYSTVLGSSGITRQNFAKYIPYPCELCNDAKAGASAERRVQDIGGSLIYLSLSNSVGGAVIHDNMILTGENARSAEFGHMHLFPNGKLCYCGQRGCMDAYCNAMVLSSQEDGNLERFFAAMEEGNQKYMTLFEQYLDNLALGINNLRMIFDYNIVLGGYVGSCIEPYIERLKDRLKTLNTFEQRGDYIYPCKRKIESSAVGAAYIFLDRFFKAL